MDYPDSLEAMSPLFTAVAHGCASNKHHEVLWEIFQERIQRRTPPFSIHKLGAIGANLAMLAHFFDSPWHEPVRNLSVPEKGFVLNAVGFCLRSSGRLHEAIQPMEIGLRLAIENKQWSGASTVAVNLSDVYLCSGELDKALRLAEQAAKFADQGDDIFQRSSRRATLGNVLHHLGRRTDAILAFRDAEAILVTYDPQAKFLYSAGAFWYCDLLLAEGKTQEVRERAEFVLQDPRSYGDLLSNALNNLSLARVAIVEAKNGGKDGEQILVYLQAAISGLRHSGMMDELPRGLLTRAELYRFTHDFTEAERDLAEVQRIATRSGMWLHLADYNLEFARLSVAQTQMYKAREHVAAARDMINRVGYHRRDKELQELETQLA